MINSLDTTCRYIKNNSKVKHALIVGSLFISSMVRKDCIVTYPNIADGSAAIIIKNTEEPYINGFIDSEYHTDSTRYDLIMSPGCGLSNILGFTNRRREEKTLLGTARSRLFFNRVEKDNS
jgi:3-oxoacyl-[acyl-carrier-protein] synthase-3